MKTCVFGPRVTPSHRIALRGVRLRARLSGMSQRTTVEQTYVNLERHAIEAVYTFPLPESAAVCGFEVVTGDRVLTGKVEEAERAVEKYEEAIGDGDAAYMVEENRPDVFTVRVGNLKGGQAVTIRLTYVCALERADKSIRVAFPTTIAPRFISSPGTDPLAAIIDGDALNPPHVMHVPYGLAMEVEVDLGRRLRDVHSPSHPVTVVLKDETRAVVTLARGVEEMNRDVVLQLGLYQEHEPVAEAARGAGGESYLAVTFVPEFDVDELVQPEPVETVFILDCSGSMQGESIAQAIAALELCLRSLSVGDTFNICRFGSTFELMRSEPLHYSQHTLEAAIHYVRHSRDLGGTELHGALEAVLKARPAVGSVRQVILLTDGQVSNEPALIELARKMRNHNRIFSFGIGSACSASLVKGVARATGGAAEFITAGERIDDKVLRTFGRLNSPAVRNVSIEWDGCDVQTLAELPPVFDGDVLTVFGRAPARAPRQVTLSCNSRSGPKRWSVPVRAAGDDGGVIATMWARRTIQSLEEVNNVHQTRYHGGKRSREAETLIRLSKEFGLLSSLTTFIAIEHRSLEERNEGRPALRRVPVLMAKGWGGIETAARFNRAMLRAGGAACYGPSSGTTIDKTLDRSCDLDALGSLEERRASDSGKKFGWFGRSRRKVDAPPMATARASEPTPHDELSAILSRLNAHGSFDAIDGLDAMIAAAGRDAGEWGRAVEQSIPVTTGGLPHRDVVVRTVMVLLLLRDRFADREAMWRRAAGKALRFLEKTLGRGAADVRAWVAGLESKLLTPLVRPSSGS
jgi:Ca-activated chloride channel family protein